MIGRTDEEKVALVWLAGKTAECRHASVIQQLLSRPVMPEEPTSQAIDALVAGGRWSDCVPIREAFIASYRALYAHLAAPKTKEVEVWRVEWAHRGSPWVHQHLTEADARSEAAALHGADVHCIRITGPHKQQVPA